MRGRGTSYSTNSSYIDVTAQLLFPQLFVGVNKKEEEKKGQGIRIALPRYFIPSLTVANKNNS